uniref:Nonstructural protein n=1 Tax=Bat hepatitis E virus TaxID=1216472 RepID=A0A8A5D6U7_9VIRU|nr:nonstructural protein [Bat hepatitis E virus]
MDASQWAAPKGQASAIEAAALAAIASSLDHAYVVTCYVSRQQAELLIEIASPMQLRFEPRSVWQHPVPRVLHNILERRARRRAGTGYLEIGAHPRSINDHPEVAHRCFLPPFGRDRQRWNDVPRRGLANCIRRGVLRGERLADGYCTLGFQNCLHHAEVGLGLYALHDMHPAEVACAMYRHGLHTLYLVLHLPVEALLPDGEYQSRLCTVLVRDGFLVVTYAGDTCAGYRHNQSVVVDWLKTTAVSGRHPVIIERVAHLGNHYLLCMTATKPQSMPYRPCPEPDVVYLTDIFGPGTHPGPFSSGSARAVSVPRSIWRRLMLFGSTLDDEAFCCSRLMTYLRGISHRVTVGNVVANEGWAPSEDVLCVTITVAYLTLAHQRWLRTQAISRGIRRLTTEHAQGLFRRVLEWLTPCIQTAAVGFYKQLKHWISSGLCLDPSSLLFDSMCRCSCGLDKAEGIERYVATPWGNLRYLDTTPKPISAIVPGELAVSVNVPTARLAVAVVEYPGLFVTDAYAEQLERDLWACGITVLVNSRPLSYTPCQYRPVDAGEDVQLRADYKITGIRRRVTQHGCYELQKLQLGGWQAVASGQLSFCYTRGPYSLSVGEFTVHVRCFQDVQHRIDGIVVNAIQGLYRLIHPETQLIPEASNAVTVNVGSNNEAWEVLQCFADGSRIVCGDLFKCEHHWLVNAANPDHLPGGGVCGVFAQRWPDLFPVSGRRVGRAVYQLTPRPVIHAVAPDFRSRQDFRALERAYQETTVRSEPAAYPVLGSGIYRVPFQASVRAWMRHHCPGDWLVIHPADLHRFVPVTEDESALFITESMANSANRIISMEREPFNKYLQGLKVEPGVVRYRFIAGVPGAGKSTGIINTGQYVVAPTKTLTKQWQARGFCAQTPHVGLVAVAGKDLIVDEAPAVPPHLLLLLMQKAAKVTLLGDPKQIPAIDFENTGLYSAVGLDLQPTEWRLETHRCPRDVVAVLQSDYPGWHTTSKVNRSLFWGLPAAGQVLVFTQAAKNSNPGSITIHEAQGATFDQTTIIATVDARGLIASSRAHAVVALTRHTRECRVIDQGGLLAEIGLTDAMVTMHLANLAPDPPSPVVAPVRDLVQFDAAPSLPPCHTDVAAALSAFAANHGPVEVAAVIPPAPPLEQGLLYFPDRLDGRDDVTVVRLSDVVHCRILAPSDRLSVISTLVGRYGKMTSTPSAEFNLRSGTRSFLADLAGVRPTELEVKELVEAMVSKGQTGELVLDLRSDDTECFRITFFQKDCNKFTLDEVVAHGKVGQGISAWPKTLCALFGPWFRAIEKRVVAQLPAGWFYGDLYTEADLHAHCIAVPPGTQVFENDFSEFDSTQNNVSLDFECQLLRETEMPEWMVRLYWLQRAYWTLVGPNTALRGCWKKHSGEPGTLLFNTIWNMVVVNACFTFNESVVHVYKGDDSMVLCRSFEQSGDAAHLITSCGLKLKQKFGPIGVFSHFICVPTQGIVRDLFRQWGRLTEKNFSDSDRMEDLAAAAADFCQSVVAEGKEHLAITLNSMYYGQPEGFFEVLWGAIQKVARGEADLTTFRLPLVRL